MAFRMAALSALAATVSGEALTYLWNQNNLYVTAHPRCLLNFAPAPARPARTALLSCQKQTG